MLHSTVKCEDCHGNNNIFIPYSLECFSCHGSEIHGVHDDLGSLCVICHGEFGADTITGFQSAGIPVSANLSSLSGYRKSRFPSIKEVLNGLFQLIKF